MQNQGYQDWMLYSSPKQHVGYGLRQVNKRSTKVNK